MPGHSADPPPEPNEDMRAPEPVPEPDELPALPRRSGRVRRHLTRPDNVYGDKHPTEITKDIERTRNWKRLVGDQPGSSRQHLRRNQPVSGDVPEPGDAEPPIAPSDSPSNSEDEVDKLVLSRLAQEGGVKFLDVLLAKAVPLDDLGSPDTSKIREWTLRDILQMPSGQQEEWRKACREELESLRKCNVYELVDPPKNRKIIKNRWVFDLKSDG